ncbi:MAG: TrkA family potassium uptake protein [Candidatus Marinimicrobia bacterium]|nr:TrkA family potassium uptake protein [bacterium]MCG2715455.1 TrkA family potassium uptake protein [Candidatus Neomarinimicrobiota bacterium]
MAKEKIFGVFGLGTFGLEVCRVISEKGGTVIAVDYQTDLIEKVKNMVTQAVLIDSTDEQSLKNAPIKDIDVAVVGIGQNIESSILTTAVLKNLGVPYIIARAVSDIHAQVLKQVGATEVINIEIEEGKRIASKLVSPDIIDKIYIGQNQILAEVMCSKSMIGKSILAIDLRKKLNINILSIKHTSTRIDELGNPVVEETVEFPSPSTIIQKDDILVVVGREKDIDKLKDI